MRESTEWGVLCTCVCACHTYVIHIRALSISSRHEHMCLDRHLFEKLKYVWHEVNIYPNKAQVNTATRLIYMQA